ncbi:cell wall hydrolase [Sphingomonas mollis]|uniref:Cell wall hydrolase n=1 Tax=Sphingomonas mollis TaxID=2795726 RepID=A0ABS0XT78_9SPHN|nr:cell wall hydrolase [Sphingomonas sp. BT553]MBJ6123229.1 cell wall hydrolase [Sphingomonas sp. BT553]
MAQRRVKSGALRRGRRRKAARDAAAKRWLLLLGIVGTVVIILGVIGPRPSTRPKRSLTMAQARASNAAVPVDEERRSTAARYRFSGGVASREQATECLATAALYEAGSDTRGQKAVIQVILNRVRAPGFPKTICGVVYQGYTRDTGCQFSFTCDGSIQRRTVHVGWARARRAARRALSGYVFPDVGRATHYHTDWMVPYWRDSLVKVARVRRHLFYVRR